MNQISIRSRLARIDFLRNAYHAGVHGLYAFCYRLSPVLLARLRYRAAWGRWPDFKNPRTMDEKLLWLMLFWRDPLKTQCGDKFAMRSYVESQGMTHVLPELYAVYDSVSEINWSVLPGKFVMKCSHGCKCNIFCRDKNKLDTALATQQLDRWMRTDFSKALGEVHYSGMVPRIICEQFLEQPGVDLVTDYKVYCFGGKAYCTMACAERQENGKPRLDFYDRDWKTILPYASADIKASGRMAPPEAYSEIIQAAERLSQPFPFVRMDFYSINGRAVLGEMTFTPGACVSQSYMTAQSQTELGDLLRLPER